MTTNLRGLGGIGLGLALAAIAVACKEDPVSKEEAAAAVAEKACRWYYECVCDPDRFTSEADCRTSVTDNIQEDLDEGTNAELVYHGECIERWLSAYDDFACLALGEVILDPPALAAFIDATDCKVYSGDRAAGQPCTRLMSNWGDDCEFDLECNAQPGMEGTCAVDDDYVAEGEACDMNRQCEAGLVCTDINGGTDTRCESLPDAGQECKGAGSLCDIGLYCEQSSGNCAVLPAAGEACAPFPGLGGTTCDFDSFCGANDTCEALPEAGEPCMGQCKVGYTCDNGTCAEQTSLTCDLTALVGF